MRNNEKSLVHLSASLLTGLLAGLIYLAFGIGSSTDAVLKQAAWGAGGPKLEGAISVLKTGFPTSDFDTQMANDSQFDQSWPDSLTYIVSTQAGDLLPRRSPVYDYWAAFTALMTQGSDPVSTTFPIRMMVSLQLVGVVFAFGFLSMALALLLLPQRRLLPLVAVSALNSFLSVALLRIANPPFSNGVIDSSISPTLTMFGLGLLVLGLSDSRRCCRPAWILLGTGGFVLGLAALNRGDLFLPLMATFLFAAIAGQWHSGQGIRIAACIPFFLLPTVAWGLRNFATFGALIPFRMRSGQNLLQPIGQCSNPWGIQYSDKWFGNYALDAWGLPHVSIATDKAATSEYLDHLMENPTYFVDCWGQRIHEVGTSQAKALLLCLVAISISLAAFKGYKRNQPLIPYLVPITFVFTGIVLTTFVNSLPRIYEPYWLVALSYLPACAILTAEWVLERSHRTPNVLPDSSQTT